MDEKNCEYDSAKRTRATNTAVLRAIVAAYLAYLGFDLLRDWIRGTSTLSPAFAWTVGLGFIAAAIAFGFYTWKRWKQELEAAALQAPESGSAEAE